MLRSRERVSEFIFKRCCIATCLKVQCIAPIKCRVTALNFYLDFCIGELYDTPTIFCKYSSLFSMKLFKFSISGNGKCPGIACANAN